MSWATLSETEVKTEGFNPSEQAALTAAAGGASGLDDIVAATVGEVRGVIEAGGYEMGAADTIPASLRPHAVALARWRWLITVPQFEQMQTAERKAAAERAEAVLDLISEGKRKVEPPTTGGSTAGSPSITGATTAASERVRTITPCSTDGL